jgi:putative ABC transport system permease protein
VYRPAPAVIYEPYAHSNFDWKAMSLVVRATVEPEMLTDSARHQVRNRDPDASVFLVRTMEQVVSDSVAGTRILSRLLTIFSALALVMASVGVYGVMSYLVSQRAHEIGVRMALGARRREVVRMVLARGLGNALLGVVLGLLCTVMMGAAMRRFVIGIGVFDMWSYFVAVSVVLAVALAASYLPAWRASRLDPLAALRDE